jgi:hypothetical protein
VKKQTYSFSELKVDRSSVERFMGFEKGNSPLPFPEIIDDVLKEAEELPNIRGGYTICSSIDLKNEKLILSKVSLNIQERIAKELSGITAVALFLCTAGREIQEWTKNLIDQGDPTTAYIVDVVGSEIAEAVADNIHDEIENEMVEKGLSVTTRFSPGYCGWEVSDQHLIFSLFPEDFCNIRLNNSALMDPIKSVSGIIGIGKQVRKRESACNFCEREDCMYRNIRPTG